VLRGKEPPPAAKFPRVKAWKKDRFRPVKFKIAAS